jgi:hypothetical protein
VSEISEHERKAIRHAVGADARRGVQGYRNRYLAPVSSDADRSWQRLVSIGYAVAHEANDLAAGCICYTVTREGCAAIGLSKAATDRACGPKARGVRKDGAT